MAGSRRMTDHHDAGLLPVMLAFLAVTLLVAWKVLRRVW